MTDLDALDRKILDLVQDDADLSTEALAGMVGLSASAVQRRLSRLKREGIIERIVALVEPRSVGRTVTVLVEVEIDNERRRSLESFQRWIGDAPEVQSCWYVTGDADYVLLVSTEDLEGYNAFIERLMTEQPVVRKYKSLIALKTVKRGLKVPARTATPAVFSTD
ncbi:Lrp/AsnC family transcriptional regulator [Microvirga thermotolerans]|uniref:Winged helix-turn-helix transcriptional regulator n=1 Tax=Microvirga thermotolerans TaxID=2651334 RepID=A0A5P9K1M8_9HYPH|nr:Lrp/AsnC family transcriptional regulator [Microvirga thermotolerans]QFU17505.1 winged helix-turn-helix transcriptional regulator [Microvirga thermotolerans]